MKKNILIKLKKSILFSFLMFFLISCQNQNLYVSKINKNVKSYQKALIDNSITASNVTIVYKDGKKIVHSIINSGKDGDMDITDNTIFPIWSMSKPITIVSMMILKERGLVDFDDPVSKYIPYFKELKCKDGEMIYECKNELKVFHLMTHRSGYKYDIAYETRDHLYKDLDDYVKKVSSMPVEFEPGTEYIYGINQAILGRIVEVISKKRFYDFLNENIFIPLNMKDTKFYLTDNERKRFQILYRKSDEKLHFTFNYDENKYLPGNLVQLGGEGLVSTMDNYSKFCEMLLNKGVFNGKRILSEESIYEMITPVSKGDGNGFDIGYSFFNLTEPLLDGVNSPKGIFGWSGYHNTHFWIDYKNNLYGLFMTRTTPFSSEIQKNFRASVYNSLK